MDTVVETFTCHCTLPNCMGNYMHANVVGDHSAVCLCALWVTTFGIDVKSSSSKLYYNCLPPDRIEPNPTS